MSATRRIPWILAMFIMAVGSLIATARPVDAYTSEVISELTPVLDPTGSYGVIWVPVELEELADIARVTEKVGDINEFFDLESEGLLYLESIVHLDKETGSTEIVYERITAHDDTQFRQTDKGPSLDTPRSCGTDSPNEYARRWGSPVSISFAFWTDFWGDSSIHDVNYEPRCQRYPCTRNANGKAGYIWTSVPIFGPTLAWTYTDFSWRSGNGSYNYWTTQAAWGNIQWNVSLYSGDSSINYLLRSCAMDAQSLTISWR